jgi:hypothetical protein
MSFTTLSPNWQVTAPFFLLLLPLCFLMKLAAFWGAPESKDWSLMLAPFPSPVSVKRALPSSAGPRLIRCFLVALAACLGAYWFYWNLWRGVRLPTILLSYAGAIILWLVSETLGSLIPFLGFPAGRLLPLPHGSSPPLAKGLSDFWGRRWNVWTSDWFRQMIFRPLHHHPVLALFVVFLASGVMHEWVINVPLYVVTGKSCFGSMMLYFLLQAVGILLERRTRDRGVRMFFAWLFVFGAAPLMVNEGLLRILHLWPE